MDTLLARVRLSRSSCVDYFCSTIRSLCSSDVLKLEKGSRNIGDGMKEVANAARDVSHGMVTSAELLENAVGKIGKSAETGFRDGFREIRLGFVIGSATMAILILIRHLCQIHLLHSQHRLDLHRMFMKHQLRAKLSERHYLPLFLPSFAASMSWHQLLEDPASISCGILHSRVRIAIDAWNEVIKGIKMETFQEQSHQKFSKGARVRVSVDAQQVRKSSGDHGGWNPVMELYCGKVGKVLACGRAGDVVVEFEDGRSFCYSPDVLNKLSE